MYSIHRLTIIFSADTVRRISTQNRPDWNGHPASKSRKCDFFGELPKIQHAFYEIYLPFNRGFLKISAVKEKCHTAHEMYQIRNNIRYKTGKRRKFAKFIEMNMQKYTILRYKKICSMFLPLQNFCKLHRAPQKSSVKKANNRFQKYQMSCYVN